jgi:hypothetical protein
MCHEQPVSGPDLGTVVGIRGWVSRGAAVSCRGTLAVRESRGRHRLLARGYFSQGPIDGLGFKVPLALTAMGYHWSTGLLGHAAATVSVSVSAEHTPKRPFEWTIRAPRAA